MSTSDMSVTYNDLKLAVAFFLGYGRDPNRWSAAQREDIDFIVLEGLRQYYYPPGGYIWSWLNKISTITISTFSTTLPNDFSSIIGTPVFTVTASNPTPPTSGQLHLISDRDLYRHLTRYGYNKGTPLYLSVAPSFSAQLTRQQQWVLLSYPIPDCPYDITIKYMAKPAPLSATNTHPLGGEVHARTVLESCLAAAEAHIGDFSGQHRERFAECLQSSIQFDMRYNLPDTYGLNKDTGVLVGYESFIIHRTPFVEYLGTTSPSAQFRQLENVLSYTFGGGDGVIRTDDNTFFAVTPTSTPSMTVNVSPGIAWINKKIVIIESQQQLSFNAPSTMSRIDLIQLYYGGELSIKQGDEATNPEPPSPDDNNIAIATISLSPSQTQIDTEHITDMRQFL